MYFPVAQATSLALLALAITGCQSGMSWPFAKKEPAVSQSYPGATPPAGYSNQASSNVQLPSTTTQPYNVGNSYAPGTNTSAAATTGVYPEAATAATNATYPGMGNTAATSAGSAYGAPAAYPNTYPPTGYAATGAANVAPQEGSYGSSVAPPASSAYPASAYGATAPASSYGSSPYGAGATTAGAYGSPATASPYGTGATGSPYPTTAAAGSYPPPSAPTSESYGAGAPQVQTADSRSRYDAGANPSGGYMPPATGYPSTSAPPAATGAEPAYQGSAYPATPASTSAPAASAPYRPGGTSDYVPTTPGGSMPSGYGATASGVRPASFDSSATPGSSYNEVATPATP